MKHFRVECLAQGHIIETICQYWDERNMIFLRWRRKNDNLGSHNLKTGQGVAEILKTLIFQIEKCTLKMALFRKVLLFERYYLKRIAIPQWAYIMLSCVVCRPSYVHNSQEMLILPQFLSDFKFVWNSSCQGHIQLGTQGARAPLFISKLVIFLTQQFPIKSIHQCPACWCQHPFHIHTFFRKEGGINNVSFA